MSAGAASHLQNGTTTPTNRSVLKELARYEQAASDRSRADRALALIERFGGLSSWAFSPELLEQARRAPRWCDAVHARLLARSARFGSKEKPGFCAPLFVATGASSALRSGFFLPLTWKRVAAHDRRLPRALCNVADAVRDALHPSGPVALGWSEGLEQHAPDLSLLPVEAGSAFAALALGLRSFMVSLGPDPRVSATACWDRYHGVRPVARSTLAAKIEASVAFGIRYLFVAEEDVEDARRLAGERLEVRALKGGVPEAERAFAALFARAVVQPGASAPFADQVSYFNLLLVGERERALKYRREVIAQTVVRLWRESGQPVRDWPRARPWPPALLVTALSHNADVALQTSLLCRPSVRCLVLYSNETAHHLETLRDAVEGGANRSQEPDGTRPPTIEAFEVESGERFLQLVERLRERIEACMVEPERIVLDVTGGPKPWSLAMAMAAPPGAGLLYFDHRYKKTHDIADPATVRLCFLHEVGGA